VPTTTAAFYLRYSVLSKFSTMSTSDSLSKLSPGLQEFVRSAARDNSAFGATDKESAEVSEWLSKASNLNLSNSADLGVNDRRFSSFR
jgi:hypothetical protein